METWNRPTLPLLPGEAPSLRLYDTLAERVRDYTQEDMRLWVCGITPYDATHLGHAFTYVSFDTLIRVWSDGGRPLAYASNVTDIDDPLFERARDTGVDWRELAEQQTQLFRDDMAALDVIPPDSWLSISEILDPLEDLIRSMEVNGQAYRVPSDDGSEFMYADVGSDPDFASAPIFEGMNLIEIFDENGGDSTQSGKRSPLDPQLWKGIRGDDFRPEGGEPGDWRPGWHIECALIGLSQLGRVDVQGGGRDLIFPHHEMSDHHIRELSEGGDGVEFHAHAGMVAFEGHKMSKSRGNLVLVSRLRESEDPRVIRLALLAHHYRSDWEYSDAVLATAQERFDAWAHAFAKPIGDRTQADEPGEWSLELLERVRANLADDLDMPSAIDAVDDALGDLKSWPSCADRTLVHDMLTTLMGVTL